MTPKLLPFDSDAFTSRRALRRAYDRWGRRVAARKAAKNGRQVTRALALLSAPKSEVWA